MPMSAFDFAYLRISVTDPDCHYRRVMATALPDRLADNSTSGTRCSAALDEWPAWTQMLPVHPLSGSDSS